MLSFVLSTFVAVKKLDVSISSLKPIKNYFIHSFIFGVTKTLPYFADKILIFPIFDAMTVGYYQFGAQFASVTSIIPIILYSYLLPKESAGKDKNLHKTKRLGFIASFAATAILFLLIPYIISNYFPSFSPATDAARIVLIAGIPMSLNAIYNSGFMSLGRSYPVVIGAILFVSLQFLLILIFGFYFGLVGLSGATVIATSCQCAFLYYYKSSMSLDKIPHDGYRRKP